MSEHFDFYQQENSVCAELQAKEKAMKIKHKDTSLMPGLSIASHEDGVWLSFDIPGKQANINLSNIAKESGPIAKETILEWLQIYATED